MSILNFNLSSDRPLLSNSWNKKQARLSKENAAAFFLDSPEASSVRSELQNRAFLEENLSEDDDRLTHWKNRGWGVSLEYYLWTQAGHLFDQGKNHQGKIQQAVKGYMESCDSPPATRRGKADAIRLPQPIALPQKSVGEVLWERECVLATPRRQSTQEILSAVLWHGLRLFRSFRALKIEDNPLNTVKSYGSAFDLYLCIYAVEGLEPGIYFYDAVAHTIELEQALPLEELWGVSFPLLLSAINQTLMTFLAIPILGHYSLDAMVVAASAAPLNMILSVTLMASLMGYRILGSKAVGSGDSTEIGSLFGNALLFSEGLAFLFVVLLALFGEMAVRICLSDTNLTHQTVQYLRILSAAYPLSILLQICLCTLGFYKKTRTILYVNLLMDALNIGLSYIFVYGCFGVFEGGVLGAAFAVPLTQFLLCIGTVWYLLKRQPWLYSACAINFQKMRQLIILSWPAMLSMLGDYFGTFITFTMIGQFLGPEMLVGGRVTWTLLMVCFVSITSMGSGFMILGGRALGQGNTSAFHRYFVCNRRMLLGIASFLGGLIFVFHTPILFFITSFETIRQELAVPLMLMGITVPLIGWSWSSASCLRLLEKVRVDMICNLLSLWLVQIPCFYLLGILWEMNLTGLILSFFIYDLVYGLSTSVCVNKFLKKPHAQEVLQGNEAVV